jgi:hypothetical protein
MSHWAWSPGRQLSRSAGSLGAYSGRSNATRLRNHDAEPVQPTRSASTVAGIDGNRASRPRTRGSTASKADPAGAREYRGGDSIRNARATVARANPSRAATARVDKPSEK